MLNNDFFNKLNKARNIIDNWNRNNDSSTLFDNVELFREVLSEFSDYFIEKKPMELNIPNIQLLQNIEFIILSFMPSYSMLLRGLNNFLSPLDFKLVQDILFLGNNNVKTNDLYDKICKIFDNNWKYTITKVEIRLILLILVPISFSALNTEDVKKHINNIIDQYVKLKNNNLIAYIYALLLIISKYDANILDFISKNDKIKILYKFKPLNNFHPYRLLENIFYNLYLKSKIKEEEIYHYTTLENLDSILKGNCLKFTKHTNLNDADEGKLLGLKQKDFKIYSFSGTHNGDSFALFNSYTNLDGISIQFDSFYYIHNLQNLKFISKKSNNMMQFLNIEFSQVYYFNSKKDINQIIGSWQKDMRNTFKDIIPKKYIDESIRIAKIYINPFIKIKPWSYEEEFRTCFILRDNLDEFKLLNAEYKDDSIFLKSPIRNNNLIKKIIIGPKIKKSAFKKEILKNLLEKHGLEYSKIVEETKINLK